MIPPCLCPMPNVEYLPLSEKAILEICKTHAPDLYARVMRLAADFVHESVRYTNAQAARQPISCNSAGK